jgi:HSP20 family molecular chaperone IbpA
MGTFNKGFDFNGSFEDILQAARDFGEKVKDMGAFSFDPCHGSGPASGDQPSQAQDFSYPPTNVHKSGDGSMVLDFALAGMDESSISVTFQGDQLVLSAKVAMRADGGDEGSFLRHDFRPRNVDRQKYRVPADDYAQELSKAVFKSGILTVAVPPKVGDSLGIRIEIEKEGV